jgi:hypothetical protein
MSICSTTASPVAPEATVSTNGYRFTTTSSKGRMPSSASWFSWSSRRRSASRPAWTLGCSVFTRPPSDSGKPVISETSLTASPASRRSAADPPVETSSTPAPASACASGSRSVLSLTDRSTADRDEIAVAVEGGIDGRAGHAELQCSGSEG